MMKPLLAATLLLTACGTEFDLDVTGSAGSCEAEDTVVARWRPSSMPLMLDRTAALGANRYVVHFADDAEAERPGPSPLMLPRERALTDADLQVIERAGGKVALRIDRQRAAAAYLSPEQLEAVKRDRRVRKVELDPKRAPLAQSVPWGISAIGAPEAWQQSAPLAPGMKACVVDSGVRGSHEELRYAQSAGSPENWADDRCGHGTHVAGTIAAYDNDVGVVGVNPSGVDIFAVKVFGDQCEWTYASELAVALDACRAGGAAVVNLSLGGFGGSEVEAQAFADAWRSGMLTVAAAGNAGGTAMEYPASYPSVISVGAVDSSREVAAFSQKNARVDLVAPGVKVESTIPFVSRHLVMVDQKSYSGGPLHNAGQTAGADGALVDGGLCNRAGSWTGKVVLCKRGEVTFAEKVTTVKRGGGVAAIVYNHEPGGFAGTVGELDNPVPAIALSGVDGDELKARAGRPARVVNELEKPGSGYASFSGTSMAAPHVTGAASLIWGQLPARTNAQVREALESTALDLGTRGRDDGSGHGMLRVDHALAKLRANPAGALPPAAGFLSECEGLTCAFRDLSLSPTGGTIVERTFAFDGEAYRGSSFRHTFTSAGPHQVRLSVKDEEGRAGEITVPISVVQLSAQGGPVKSSGAREVSLTWRGVFGPTVLVVRNGEILGSAENTGGGIDVVEKANGPLRYRICSPGAESCSQEVTVLPVCA